MTFEIKGFDLKMDRNSTYFESELNILMNF
jgi:hypothetical protein